MDHLDYIKPAQRNRQKRRDKRLYEELIECRRYGGGDRLKKCRDKGDLRKLNTQIRKDSLASRSSYRAKRKSTFQDDNLEPLIRLLESNKGRKWNDVYSDLSKQLDTRSATGLHVLQHLWDFVTVNVKRENGKLVFYNKTGGNRVWSVQFYVDPDTNILHSRQNKIQRGPFPKKARWKKEKQKNKLKRKLGIVDNPKHIYKYPQIKTYQQQLIVGRVYDCQQDEGTARVVLCAIENKQFLKLTLKVIKSDHYALGEEIVLDSLKKTTYKIVNHCYIRQKDRITWQVFDTGKFSYQPQRLSEDQIKLRRWHMIEGQLTKYTN